MVKQNDPYFPNASDFAPCDKQNIIQVLPPFDFFKSKIGDFEISQLVCLQNIVY